MSFVRAFIGRDSGAVQHLIETASPFVDDGPMVRVVNDRGEPVGEGLDLADLGWMEPTIVSYQTLDGRPCSPSRHIFDRLKNRPAPTRDELAAGLATLPRFHDCPCCMNGIRARLRAGGPGAIPIMVRAWLATVLPPDQTAEMGIGRGLPISALKACEAIRTRRDPQGGSRLAYFEAVAQRQHEARRVRIERGIRQKAERASAATPAAGQSQGNMRGAPSRPGASDGNPSVR